MKKPQGYDLIVKAKMPFALQVQGSCLAPDIRHGDRVIIDPRESVRPGDYAMVAFRPSVVREGGMLLQVRFLWSLPAVDLSRLPYKAKPDDIIKIPVLGFETFNPPMWAYAELRHLTAVFKVVEVQRTKRSVDFPAAAIETDPTQVAAAAGW